MTKYYVRYVRNVPKKEENIMSMTEEKEIISQNKKINKVKKE